MCNSLNVDAFFFFKSISNQHVLWPLLAPEVMDPISEVKPKDSTTLMVTFSLKSGATHYIIRITNNDGFFREDTVSSSPAELKSLSPYTEYTLKIMAGNSVGHSQPSLPVIAKTGRLFIRICHHKLNRLWPCLFCALVQRLWKRGHFSGGFSHPAEDIWPAVLHQRDTQYFKFTLTAS